MTRPAVGLVTLLALAGCSPLAPRPDRTRYYTLAAVADAPGPGVRHDVGMVGLGPVELAGYLDRAELVSRVEPNRVAYSPTARWAAPLRAQIPEVLALDLARRLGADQVLTFPWAAAPAPRYVVDVDIPVFERAPDGTVTLVATWQLRDRVGGARRDGNEVVINERAAAATDAAAVAAMSRALDGLAARLAAAIGGQP